MTAVATIETPNAVVVRAPGSITDLLALAVEKGTPVDALEKLVALHERLSERQAQQDFADAMAAFQAQCPPIKRTSTAQFATRGGGNMGYTFAALDEIAATVNPILTRHGLSYTWDSTVTGGAITCVCVVRHRNGHSERATITLPTESPSAMSSQQKVGSALTFARRLSLTQALGLTTTDDDVDGAEVGARSDTITEDQVATLVALAEEVGVTGARWDRYLKHMAVDAIEALPASRYADAVASLERKRAAA